ncbi:Bug family tripartite tricarboxylate transporter substrate binding protein [Paradesulfitobacterium ferrireducens]|uniref:Bug family tripartite tricarboxylate transporter substrate binding protein n=1 Tax=Paradesulfitobacterium ferrireducens TaxID=2816476 RepID=UPI001A8DEEA4|nr:tripartite tricarboxylate transporter substrate binding protein [Paradesulfitobacterium ferrireducens]
MTPKRIKRHSAIALLLIFMLLWGAGCGSSAAKDNAGKDGAGAAGKTVDFPTKDITFIVPVSPGGGYDTYSRILAQYMPKYLPKPVNIIIKNMPGGEWNIGLGELNRAKPDGYTIGIFNIPGNVVNQIMGASYDLNKMTWIGRVTDTVYVGALSPKSKFKTLEDLKKADEVKVGVVGLSSTAGLGSLIALQEMGIKAKFVTHPGSTEAVMAAIRGDVDYVQYPYPTLKKFIVDSQQLNPIIIFYPERHKDLPNVPTVKEAGYSQLLDVVKADYLVGGTPGIPPEIAKILRDAFQQTMKDPEVMKKMEEFGQPARPASDEEAARIIADSLKVFGKYKDLVAQNQK